MTAQRLLITGAGGQLGTQLRRLAPHAIALGRANLDVTDRRAVHAAVAAHRPDVIIHAAAMTLVDRCETEVDEAVAGNTLACRWLAEAAEDHGSRIVAVSTDYVFSGDRGAGASCEQQPWNEWDATEPRSVYGQTKLAGERELRTHDTVVRTAWLAGAGHANIISTVLRLAAASTPLTFVDDQFGSPTFTEDLAPLLLRLADDGVTGVVHGVNQGATDWCSWVRRILSAAGHSPELVSSISTAELDPPRPAPRPAYSVLDDAVLRQLDLRLPHHDESLDRLVGAFVAGL